MVLIIVVMIMIHMILVIIILLLLLLLLIIIIIIMIIIMIMNILTALAGGRAGVPIGASEKQRILFSDANRECNLTDGIGKGLVVLLFCIFRHGGCYGICRKGG